MTVQPVFFGQNYRTVVALTFFKLRRQPFNAVLCFRFTAYGVYRNGILAGRYGERRTKPLKAPFTCDASSLLKADFEALKAPLSLLGLVFKALYAGKVILAAPRLNEQLCLYAVSGNSVNELLLRFQALVVLGLGVKVWVIPQNRHVKIL